MRLATPASALLLVLALTGATNAAPAPCAWEGPRLRCPEPARGSKGARAMAVIQSLAATDPAALYADPFTLKEAIATPGARERFRRQMERLKVRIERGRRAIEWRRRRGRLSRTDYKAWLATYQRAVATYREGVWFYKSLGWVTPDR